MVPHAVLVVDDDATIRTMLAIALPRFGLPVFLACDAEEALTLYQQYQQLIGVALIDVQMPGRNGLELLAALRQLNPQVRAVLMSGDPRVSDAWQAGPAGQLGWGTELMVEKLFPNLEELTEVLQLALAGTPACASRLGPAGRAECEPVRPGRSLPPGYHR